MSDGDYGSDAPTGTPPTLERHAPRLDDGHEVIEDAIGDVFRRRCPRCEISANTTSNF